MRDLRHHPLLLFIELNLLFGIGAILVLHLAMNATVPDSGARAFAAPQVEGSAPPQVQWEETPLVNIANERNEALAHIFRKNPSDRWRETQATPGDDYFLEDLAELRRSDDDCHGAAPYRVTLAPRGNRMYVVHGNLWVHSHEALSLSIAAEDGPARVTFVVLGDIYFLDSFRYERADDAVLFMALKNNEGRGGSIWLGDTGYGTLSHIDGWLYAEEDILGDMLDTPTVVHGAMAAGRYIHVRENAATGRRLRVDFDERLMGGRGWVPGL